MCRRENEPVSGGMWWQAGRHGIQGQGEALDYRYLNTSPLSQRQKGLLQQANVQKGKNTEGECGEMRREVKCVKSMRERRQKRKQQGRQQQAAAWKEAGTAYGYAEPQQGRQQSRHRQAE